jgi:hypothetical protein
MNFKYSKEDILKSAKKYKTIKDWYSSEHLVYGAAHKRKLLELATKHMRPLGSRFYRCLYSIQIRNTKKIYIGLTFNFEVRIRNHLQTKRFIKYSKKNLIIKKLTKYIHRDQASKLEKKLINKSKDNGYELLNKIVGGGLGGDTLIWTKKKVLDSSRNYTTIREWGEKEPGAYQKAGAGGYIKEATKHMQKLWEKKWTKKIIIEDAKKYKTKSEWQKKSTNACAAATRHKWYKQATEHMPSDLNSVNLKWTDENILKDALKYKFKSQWSKSSSGAYSMAKKRNLFKKATQHMSFDRNRKWTKEKVLKDSLKYKKLISWRTDHKNAGAYAAALRGGYYKEAISHMKSGYEIWTREKILLDSKKYKYRGEWAASSAGAYDKAHSIGIFKEATAHMPKKRPNKN